MQPLGGRFLHADVLPGGVHPRRWVGGQRGRLVLEPTWYELGGRALACCGWLFREVPLCVFRFRDFRIREFGVRHFHGFEIREFGLRDFREFEIREFGLRDFREFGLRDFREFEIREFGLRDFREFASREFVVRDFRDFEIRECGIREVGSFRRGREGTLPIGLCPWCHHCGGLWMLLGTSWDGKVLVWG